MSAARYSTALIGAALVSSCGTPEQGAWFTGVPASDAQEISRFIVARTHGQIAYYSREPDGSISDWMRSGHDQKFGDIGRGDRPFHAYVVRRVRGKWQIVDERVLVF